MSNCITKGDIENIFCPYCKSNNTLVNNNLIKQWESLGTVIKVIDINNVFTLHANCHYCKQMIHYTVKYELVVTARKLD